MDFIQAKDWMQREKKKCSPYTYAALANERKIWKMTKFERKLSTLKFTPVQDIECCCDGCIDKAIPDVQH